MIDTCAGDYGGCSNRVPCAYCKQLRKEIRELDWPTIGTEPPTEEEEDGAK